MTKYKINEHFSTVQGEGFWTGVPATFIRLQGCAVGCPWCDTKYTWAEGGEWMEVEDIVQLVQHKHVVITGGEPTYWNLDDLIVGINQRLNNTAFVQVESSGHKELKGNVVIDWLTWSPKKNLEFQAPESFKMLVDEIKFVVDEELTYADVEQAIAGIDTSRHGVFKALTFMAEGCPPSAQALARAIDFAREFDGAAERVMVSDRLQYRAEVK